MTRSRLGVAAVRRGDLNTAAEHLGWRGYDARGNSRSDAVLSEADASGGGRKCRHISCQLWPGDRFDIQRSFAPKPPGRFEAKMSVRPSADKLGCMSLAVVFIGAAMSTGVDHGS